MGRIRRPTQGAGGGISFGADHNSLVTDMTCSYQLKGNMSVTYVTLVPWRREWRCHVPLPQSLYHSWAAGSPARLLSENMIYCNAPAASYTHAARCGSQMRNNACQCSLARLVTLKGSRRDPIRRSPMWRLRSLLQGFRVTYVTEMLSVSKYDNRFDLYLVWNKCILNIVLFLPG